MKKDLLKIEDIYEALTLLPILSDYTEPGVRSISELALCINNSEAFLNLLIYFSGKHIRFPKIEDVELTLKLLLAYKYNMEKGIKPTSILYYNALYKYNIKINEENKQKFKQLTRYFKRQRKKERNKKSKSK